MATQIISVLTCYITEYITQRCEQTQISTVFPQSWIYSAQWYIIACMRGQKPKDLCVLSIRTFAGVWLQNWVDMIAPFTWQHWPRQLLSHSSGQLYKYSTFVNWTLLYFAHLLQDPVIVSCIWTPPPQVSLVVCLSWVQWSLWYNIRVCGVVLWKQWFIRKIVLCKGRIMFRSVHE